MKTDNELIAEFMGWERYSRNSFKCPNIYPIENTQHYGWTTFLSEQLEFNVRWDWIMPVWMKFRDLDLESNPEYEQWIHSLQWYLFSSDEPGRFCDRLVYAIKWYNEHITAQSAPQQPAQ
jgi:hypothetical protein